MKGEYNLEEKDHHPHNNIFPNMRHTQNFQHHHHQPPLHHPHHRHFQLTTSEESGSQSPTAATTPTPTLTTATTKEPNSDGATIEVVRRPRGRPPGSKNKPKPPVIITREPEPAMNPYVLEIPGGVDLIESINRFSRKRNIGICILSASGSVANVTLRQPATTSPGGATVTFHGRFDLLSLSATILPTTASFLRPSSGNEQFAISLAGPQGQIVGGTAVGPLFAAGTVYVIAASFNNPSYHRLPVDEDVRSSGSGGNEGRSSSPPVVQGGGAGGHTAAESCGVSSFYGGGGGHLGSSDVIWAPTARQPPPPPHY